ncbi:TetR family transcriptional regulator OS=Streptomyces fumanus OX=67302 GN=GCM10018772_69830 PE=4 SV=1 [Streptomyces fumanus]
MPGYEAPEDTLVIASEIMNVLLDAAQPPGTAASTPPDGHPDTRLEAHLAQHRQWAADHPAAPAALRRALRFWTRLHGILSLELAGHFTGMGLDPAELYDSELRHLSQ